MGKKGFFVSHQNKTLGPWSLDEIQAGLKKGEISYVDFIWNPADEQWQLLAMYFHGQFQPPPAPPEGYKPTQSAASAPGKPLPQAVPNLKKYASTSFDQSFGISNESIWFLYKDKEKYGPYRFLEIVQLLQERKCDPADFVWKPGFNDWERIRAVPEFSTEILSRLSNVKTLSGISLETVFIKRQFPRVPYDGEVILHDDKQVVIGSATTISEGGAFVRVAKPVHARGDRLKLHFSAAGVPVPFNCIAEVTQVCKTEPMGYCLKFIYLEEDDQNRIAQFAQSETHSKEA